MAFNVFLSGLSSTDIDPTKTRIARSKISTPVESFLYAYCVNNTLHSILGDKPTILDYGAGNFTDVGFLKQKGFDAVGWEPLPKEHGEKRPSDLVFLTYVLNVIPDIKERAKALKEAYKLAKKVLVVSVRMDAAIDDASNKVPYNDGYKIKKGKDWTFQKRFTEEDITNMLSILDTKYTKVYGMDFSQTFIVFKNITKEQELNLQKNVGESNVNDYLIEVQKLKKADFGKKLPGEIYLHKSVVPALSKIIQKGIAKADQAAAINWDIVKIQYNKYKLSLLSYPDFTADNNPFPYLTEYVNVNLCDLSTSKTLITGDNRPIIHQKELMMLPKDRKGSWIKLTEKLADAELLGKKGQEKAARLHALGVKRPDGEVIGKTIGYKLDWQTLLKHEGFKL